MSTGVDPRRAVDPAPGGEDAADPPAQLGFRLGPVLEGGKGLSEVATELGVGTGQLSTWRGEQLAAGSAEALAARKAAAVFARGIA